MALQRFFVWRSLRRETTIEVLYARTMEDARIRYGLMHNLHLRMVEAKRA